jgi:hypothetical protein
MKRYIFTSPDFEGEIHVLYGTDQQLLLIDFMKVDLKQNQLDYFKERLPSRIDVDDSELVKLTVCEWLKYQMGTKNRLSVIEQGYRVTFEQWWTRYNVKRNRTRCEKLWNKLSEADQVNAFAKLQLYERHLMVNNWKTKAEPDTYLRNRYWEGDWTK